MNVNNNAIKRIMADVRELAKHPSPRYSAAPLEDNVFEWHFSIRGPSGTDFEGGTYHGRILLPSEYPFKPPNIIFLTKTGRFEVGTKICLSISAYHEESWQPAWGVRTMLEAIISFLPSEGAGSIGSLEYSKAERQKLAKESLSYCCACCGPIASLLSDINEKEIPDTEVANQISQLRLAGSVSSPKTPTQPPPNGVTATPDNNQKNDINSSGKSPTQAASITEETPAKMEQNDVDSVSGKIPPNSADMNNSATKKSPEENSTRKDDLHMTSNQLFDDKDIDNFVSHSYEEAVRDVNENSENSGSYGKIAGNSFASVSRVEVTAAISTSATHTEGSDKAACSCQHGSGEGGLNVPHTHNSLPSASASSVSEAANKGDVAGSKEALKGALNEEQGARASSAVNNDASYSSATPVGISLESLVQSPHDVTDNVLTAFLYIIGSAMCLIIFRRVLLLWMSGGNSYDTDGDL